jgi:hypothetical protein
MNGARIRPVDTITAEPTLSLTHVGVQLNPASTAEQLAEAQRIAKVLASLGKK